MFPTLVELLLILLTAVTLWLTWSTVRGRRGLRSDRRERLDGRECTLAAGAQYHQADLMEAAAKTWDAAGHSTAQNALDSASEMRSLARRLDPDTPER